jgi:hypothetical protein
VPRLVCSENLDLKVFLRCSQDAPGMDPGSSFLHSRFDMVKGKPQNGLAA